MTIHLLLGNNVNINVNKIKSAYQVHGHNLNVQGGKRGIDCSIQNFLAGDIVMILAKSRVESNIHKIELCKNTIKIQEICEVLQNLFKQQVHVELFTSKAGLVDAKCLPEGSILASISAPDGLGFDSWGEYMMLSIF